MRYGLWMHGLGKSPESAAGKLADAGFTTVVCSKSQVGLVRSKGMDAFVSSGSFRGPDFTGDEYLAQDCFGRPQHWFYSTCPTRDDVRAYNLDQIRKLAKELGLSGILLDGARFASPASSPLNKEETDPSPEKLHLTGMESFFTCFCPSCCRKMKEMGYEAEKIRPAVQALARLLGCGDGKKATKKEVLEGLPRIQEWLDFRRRSSVEHLLNFVRTVKETNPDLAAGAYLFTPSLSDLVGQHYPDLAGRLDLVCPMIYRDYLDPDGPACLNVETAVMARQIDGSGQFTKEERDALMKAVTGLDTSSYKTWQDLFRDGYQPSVVKDETQRAALRLGSKRASTGLVPIIQIDDPKLDTSVKAAFSGGADAVNFFVYYDDWMDRWTDFFKSCRQA